MSTEAVPCIYLVREIVGNRVVMKTLLGFVGNLKNYNIGRTRIIIHSCFLNISFNDRWAILETLIGLVLCILINQKKSYFSISNFFRSWKNCQNHAICVFKRSKSLLIMCISFTKIIIRFMFIIVNICQSLIKY